MTPRCRIRALFVLLTASVSVMTMVRLTSSAVVTGRSEANKDVVPASPNGIGSRGLGRGRRSVSEALGSRLEEGTSSSWAEVDFVNRTKKIGWTQFHSFLLNVYNDTGNKGPNSPNNRYFYTPVSFLNTNDTYCASYADGLVNEVVIRFTMWDQESDSSAVGYLNSLLCKKKAENPTGCPITNGNVEVIPFKQMKILQKKTANKAQFYGCTLDSPWHSYHGQQVVEFTMSCSDWQACESLAKGIQEKPHRFANDMQVALRLTLGTTRTGTKRIQATSLLDGTLAARIDQHFRKKGKNVHRALMTADVYGQLLREVFTNVVIDTFDDSDDLVDDWTRDKVAHLLERFLNSSETWIQHATSKTSWESVFWMEENYRPDKMAATLNEIHKNLGTKERKYLEEALRQGSEQTSSHSTKLGGGGLGVTVNAGNDGSSAKEMSKSTSMKAEDFSKLLQNAQEHVKWDGEKFVPKEMKLVGVTLSKLRDTKSLTDQLLEVRYASSVLMAPVNLQQPTKIHTQAVPESFLRLRDIERDIYGKMERLEIKNEEKMNMTLKMEKLVSQTAANIESMKSRMEKLEVQNDHLGEENKEFRRLHSELTELRGAGKNRSMIDVLRRRLQGLDVVAFEVYHDGSGLLSKDSVITYKGARFNLGGAIAPGEGVFRAPCAGVYAFGLFFSELNPRKHLVSSSMKMSDTVPTEDKIPSTPVGIRVNGELVATTAYGPPVDFPHYTNSGISVVVQLAAGDKVDAFLGFGDPVTLGIFHFNGFLVAEIF